VLRPFAAFDPPCADVEESVHSFSKDFSISDGINNGAIDLEGLCRSGRRNPDRV
jgi:hypothetical protein